MVNFYNKNYKILIADDHLVVQQGMRAIIKDFLPQAGILLAGSLDDALSLLKAQEFDLLILDINIPGGNSFQMIDQVRGVRPDTRILLFSAYDERVYGLRYLKTGIDGYLQKSSSERETRNAIMKVLTEGRYISSQVQDLLLDNYPHFRIDRLSTLSNRELEIARLLINGERTSGIADKLELKLSTVSTYKNRIFEKLNVANISELIEEFRLDLQQAGE
ncbi:LuxR family two component transcriptional regulator [Anseongella ginsenosidimutans]|uniref:LuxR family two component transcriptional regulator n=1 Tax=Anseongella ginsenosidimutans TaxID=496056 RepID=A0A4R3KMT5_9SPHI|nr:response regulator transcription factor [Anseongella ginsenosidimutans]QEC51493.1 response regulator transcription factor [Anseongella ginsenosidimutans]TCS84328.1 LuxR family two component transcriptional regulator [Anseongella ginsenosidimutans]